MLSKLYECPVAAITKYHKREGLKHRNVSCHSSRGQRSGIKVSVQPRSPAGSVPGLSQPWRCWQSSGFPGL